MDPMVVILNEIDDVLNCPRCRLALSRTNVVVGDGPLDAKIFFIGEAPGRSEDKAGKPFVGAAGKILSEALAKAGIDRSSVYITNVVKCRPPENRVPMKDEIAACNPYLRKQLAVIKPRVIVLLGKTAAEEFLQRKVNMKEEHGKVLSHDGANVVIAYHPAAVIYSRKLMDILVEDLTAANALLAR